MTDPILDDDEALSALLDGALAAADAAALRQRIAREPALAARFAALEGATARVSRAYADVAAEPVPDRMVALLDDRSAAAKVFALGPRRAREPARGLLFPVALAAGIALAAGVALGLLFGPRTLAPDSGALLAAAGGIARGGTLHAVLEATPSGTTRDVGSNVAAEPRLTFRARDGGFCRRVDLASARETAVVLACRRAGEWRIEAASFARAASAPGGVYRPAAEPPTAVEAAIDAAIDGEPLEPDTENALLASGWAAER